MGLLTRRQIGLHKSAASPARAIHGSLIGSTALMRWVIDVSRVARGKRRANDDRWNERRSCKPSEQRTLKKFETGQKLLSASIRHADPRKPTALNQGSKASDLPHKKAGRLKTRYFSSICVWGVPLIRATQNTRVLMVDTSRPITVHLVPLRRTRLPILQATGECYTEPKRIWTA